MLPEPRRVFRGGAHALLSSSRHTVGNRQNIFVPGWLVPQLAVTAEVKRFPYVLHKSGLSDHSALVAQLVPCSDPQEVLKAIHPEVYKSPAYDRYLPRVLEVADTSGMTPLAIRLSQAGDAGRG